MERNRLAALAVLVILVTVLLSVAWTPAHPLAPALFICTGMILFGIGEVVKAILSRP